jgi:hypothetical protein
MREGRQTEKQTVGEGDRRKERQRIRQTKHTNKQKAGKSQKRALTWPRQETKNKSWSKLSCDRPLTLFRSIFMNKQAILMDNDTLALGQNKL